MRKNVTILLGDNMIFKKGKYIKTNIDVYSCAGVPLFRRNGNRQSGGRKPLNRNRDTALKCLLPASLLA